MLQHKKRRALLGHEIELLIGERQTLLQVVGASAALIACLDCRLLPPGAIKPADLVASRINALSDETLCDALVAVSAGIDEETSGVGE